MKLILSVTLLLQLFALSFAISQKEILEFLAQHGDELVKKTETFLHEQRRLNHENLIHNVEKNIIEVENLVIELRTYASKVTTEDEQTLHEIHQHEYKLFALENSITEETLRIAHLTGQQTNSTPTTPITTVITTTVATRATPSPATTNPTTSQPPVPITTTEKPVLWTTWSPNRAHITDPNVLKAVDVLDRVGDYYRAHPSLDVSTKARIENEVTVLRQLIYNIVDLRNNNKRYLELLDYHANYLTDILDKLH